MEVPVDALDLRRRQLGSHRLGDAEGDLLVARPEVVGPEAALRQNLERLVDVALQGELRAVRRRPAGADRVHAPDRAADVPALLGVELVEGASPHLGERGVQDALDLVERVARAEVERRHGGELGGGQVQEEPVLVENRLARPAAGPVELHHEAALVLQLHLVHTVLEGPEREAAARARSPPTSTASSTRSG